MALEQIIEPNQVITTTVKILIESVVFRFQHHEGPEPVTDPGIYAFANISFYDQHNNNKDSKIVMFTKDELADWGADDSFIVDLVKTKLNLA